MKLCWHERAVLFYTRHEPLAASVAVNSCVWSWEAGGLPQWCRPVSSVPLLCSKLWFYSLFAYLCCSIRTIQASSASICKALAQGHLFGMLPLEVLRKGFRPAGLLEGGVWRTWHSPGPLGSPGSAVPGTSRSAQRVLRENTLPGMRGTGRVAEISSKLMSYRSSKGWRNQPQETYAS